MNTIKHFRERVKISQAQLAGLLGMSQQMISFYEHGTMPPISTCKDLIKIAQKFKVRLKVQDIVASYL
jgi:putative transcriptional regulator